MQNCDLCRKSFRQSGWLRRHLLTAHGITHGTKDAKSRAVSLGAANGHISLTRDLMQAMNLKRGDRIFATLVDGVLQLSARPGVVALPILTSPESYFVEQS